MDLNEYLRQFSIALSEEISAARKLGGRKVTLTEGRYLGPRDTIHLYSFTTDTELKFPDDTPVDLELKGQKFRGYILSLHQFDLIVGLLEHIGDKILSARMSTEPWFLLEELKERLVNIPLEPDANRDLIRRLLDPNTQATQPDTAQAHKLLEEIEQETGHRIVCNPHQLKAVGHVLANPVSFIWGPPGTGKTSTLGATVAALVAARKSVLILSHSNVAVDVAVVSVARNLERAAVYRDCRLLRYGFSYMKELDQYARLHVRGIVRSQNPDLIRQLESLEDAQRKLTKQSREEDLSELQKNRIKRELQQTREKITPLRAEIAEKEKALVKDAQVIGCTLSKASIDDVIFRRKFDAVLIDEASMVYIPHGVFATSLARERVAIYGDFRQLPPISQSESFHAKEWLQRDIFEHAGIVEKVNRRHPDSRLVLLATQYRMHPDIAAIPNHLFYNGRLENGPKVKEENLATTAIPPSPGSAVVFCDLSFIGGNCYHTPLTAGGSSRFNLISALIAVNIAHRILTTSPYSVGIITPYNAQTRLIRNLLSDFGLRNSSRITVDTVHRFQGSEQEVIIFDMVEAGNSRKPGKLLEGGMGSMAMRLANVAISRAKGKFILLADLRHIRDHFSSQDCFRQFIDEVKAKGTTYEVKWPASNQPGIWTDQISQIAIDRRIKNADILADIDHAERQVIISQSGSSSLSIPEHTLIKWAGNSSRALFINGAVSKEYSARKFPSNTVLKGSGVSGLDIIGIDGDHLWISATTGPSAPVIRLNAPKTIQLLYDFWELTVIPEHAQSGEKRVAGKGEPVGRVCPECKKPLIPRTNRSHTPYLKCSSLSCDHTEAMTDEDATYLAVYLKLKCEKCGQPAVGKKGRSVFIGCSSFPKCNWSISIEDILRNRPI